MTHVDRHRRFFAEEIQALCNLRTPALVEALALIGERVGERVDERVGEPSTVAA